MNHPNPRSPFVLSTNDLARRPGAMHPVQRSIPIPDDFGADLIRIPTGGAFDLNGKLESVVEGVVLTASVSTTIDAECSRCLRPFTEDLVVEICELYAYPDSTTDQTADTDEVSRLQDEMLDTEQVIRDAVLLTLPAINLCVPDCPGLCPECGVHWDDLPSDHHHESMDPRWSALKDFGALRQWGSSGALQGLLEGSADSTKPSGTGAVPEAQAVSRSSRPTNEQEK